MKKLQLFVCLIIALFALNVSQQKAQAFFFTYTAGFQVQNLSGTQANIQITFYNAAPGGGVAGTLPDTIPGNGSKTYFPISAVPSGFNGSAVISSDQQVAAVVNILGNNGIAGASYVGFNQGNTSLQIPLLMKGNYGYNTWFKVQNAGSSTATVNVNYSDGTSASQSVPPGASATFDQSVESHSATVFAATVSSSQPLVATVIEESAQVMFAYNGFTGGSTAPVMPLVNANYFGYITGIQIQNGGGSTTNVTVSYTPAPGFPGTACTETQTIGPGQSQTFALYAFSVSGTTSSTCSFGSTFVGSAKVTANSASQPLSVIVNQLNAGAGNGEAYNGFDPNAATAKVVLPLIMDRNYNYFTGISVMNVGGSTTTINCTFTGTSYSLSQSVAPGATLTAVQQGAIAPGYVGSGTCTAGGGGKIVAVVNELNSTDAGDRLLVYEGINN